MYGLLNKNNVFLLDKNHVLRFQNKSNVLLLNKSSVLCLNKANNPITYVQSFEVGNLEAAAKAF